MKKKVDMLESEPEKAPDEYSIMNVPDGEMAKFIAPDQVEEVFTVDVVTRVRYSFVARSRKEAITMVKAGEFPKDKVEVLKAAPQLQTITTVGYRLKN